MRRERRRCSRLDFSARGMTFFQRHRRDNASQLKRKRLFPDPRKNSGRAYRVATGRKCDGSGDNGSRGEASLSGEGGHTLRTLVLFFYSLFTINDELVTAASPKQDCASRTTVRRIYSRQLWLELDVHAFIIESRANRPNDTFRLFGRMRYIIRYPVAKAIYLDLMSN